MSMLVSLFPVLMMMSSAQASTASPPIVTLVGAVTPTPDEALASGLPLLTPAQAIIAAAEAAPRGAVRGVFEMSVQRAQAVGPRFFLNSQPDYRDQRNLSVAIHPIAVKAVRARFGKDLSRAFLGRTVRVFGRAERVRIDFTDHGRPNGKYYYQTHVTVFDPRQIEVE